MKAWHLDDEDASDEIHRFTSPKAAADIAKKIKGFNTKRWGTHCIKYSNGGDFDQNLIPYLTETVEDAVFVDTMHAVLYGFDVVCYEAQGEIGGLWRYKPEETDESSVMKSTVINSSKELTACNYLEEYAKHFKLAGHIKLYHKVLNIERHSDYAKTGKWTVIVKDLKSGTQSTEVFDGVLLCTGHHTLPYWPKEWKGQREFKGKMMHAHSYKDYKGFDDKVVAVVGIGNSGGDIATELSKVAKQVYLVTRSGSWVFNRVFDYGRPIDSFLNSRFYAWLRTGLPPAIMEKAMQDQLNKRFDHALFGLKPKHAVFRDYISQRPPHNQRRAAQPHRFWHYSSEATD
ncbi:hypothetical protein PRIPAC_76296 [Pristionchus pacificus]|uniref:Flavin-containing monooxygenase n=1 Tax=Pristionchus pacificus TaxID=54126 RepID=A0A2A6C1G7_PRIPA|nr:hypothetical protein PRIPAC_76296 [Pristionchus pacificus]|eukprot:PDM71949.1 hypothetical protein PRIPAC_38356 [Pristionchus pacificus]